MVKFRKLSACLLTFAMVVPTILPVRPAQAASGVKVKSITFAKPAVQTLALKKGETYRPKVNVIPKKGKNSIKFSSSKKAVVQVTGKGVLKARKAGTATVSAVSTSKPKKKAKIKVTVYKKFQKVKKVSFDKSSAALKVGESLALKTVISPGKATVKKVTYQTSEKSVATVNAKGVVTAKKPGAATVTAYAKDGRGAKAVCRLTVQDASSVPAASSAVLPTASGSQAPAATERPPEEKFVIASASQAVPVYVDGKGDDYDGLSLVAESFAKDVALVTNSGASSQVVDKLEDLKGAAMNGTAIICGSVGNNDVIDSLVSQGKLDVAEIQGKWETYKIQFVKDPAAGVGKAIVVVGSDKRGAIYGLYHISEAMGVSPWVYWGDAVPDKHEEIVLSNWELEMTSKEPSVKYREVLP